MLSFFRVDGKCAAENKHSNEIKMARNEALATERRAHEIAIFATYVLVSCTSILSNCSLIASRGILCESTVTAIFSRTGFFMGFPSVFLCRIIQKFEYQLFKTPIKLFGGSIFDSTSKFEFSDSPTIFARRGYTT